MNTETSIDGTNKDSVFDLFEQHILSEVISNYLTCFYPEHWDEESLKSLVQKLQSL